MPVMPNSLDRTRAKAQIAAKPLERETQAEAAALSSALKLLARKIFSPEHRNPVK